MPLMLSLSIHFIYSLDCEHELNLWFLFEIVLKLGIVLAVNYFIFIIFISKRSPSTKNVDDKWLDHESIHAA